MSEPAPVQVCRWCMPGGERTLCVSDGTCPQYGGREPCQYVAPCDEVEPSLAIEREPEGERS